LPPLEDADLKTALAGLNVAMSKPAQAPLLFGDEAAWSATSAPRLGEWAPETWDVSEGWKALVDPFLHSPSGQALGAFVKARLADGAVVYPPKPFWALALTPLKNIKVVILGQDPYHGAGQAQGLAFSVAPGVKPPPSLRNIFKEIDRDPLLKDGLDSDRTQGSLDNWARQGVLLLNTCLTVEDGLPASHAHKGWEALTDAIVKAVAKQATPVVFMLWGKHAQAKKALIEAAQLNGDLKEQHLVLTANHPSPLSATRKPEPFLGCGHFSAANAFLIKQGVEPIKWAIRVT